VRILEKFRNLIAKKKVCPNTAKVQEFMAEIDMTFNGYGGLSMHRLAVSEFGYLIRYLTGGKIESFSDFRVIVENKEVIDESIKKELSKDVLRESEVFGYSRETTEGNILRLQKIVNSICEYTALCDRLGVNIYAARESA
jgi:hypothetical protein